MDPAHDPRDEALILALQDYVEFFKGHKNNKALK
jgi:hypothetical protein